MQGALRMQAYEHLRQLIDSCQDDVQKAAGGNKAAGTRVRKVMQEVREAAKQLRSDILGAQKSD
ncbi:MAG: histone H1 [Phycisphaera sp. TMED9]|nr:MAG: histone H1 [Phycisphaera sp. TMED9]